MTFLLPSILLARHFSVSAPLPAGVPVAWLAFLTEINAVINAIAKDEGIEG